MICYLTSISTATSSHIIAKKNWKSFHGRDKDREVGVELRSLSKGSSQRNNYLHFAGKCISSTSFTVRKKLCWYSAFSGNACRLALFDGALRCGRPAAKQPHYTLAKEEWQSRDLILARRPRRELK